ncbi:MAG TPA: hypothetical protein VM509_05725 [Planctomycetota bacterium]|nr:hypothetical protein [Planctomycetota bacterium]
MYFDFFIVLVFVAVGGLWHLARRPPQAAQTSAEEGSDAGSGFSGAVIASLFTAALALLFPWALVLHDCLDDRGPAQSLGIGATALLEGALFVGILLLGAWHARKSA